MPDFSRRNDTFTGAGSIMPRTLTVFRRLPAIARCLMYILPAASAVANAGAVLGQILSEYNVLEGQSLIIRAWTRTMWMVYPPLVFLQYFVPLGFVWFFASWFCKVLEKRLATPTAAEASPAAVENASE